MSSADDRVCMRCIVRGRVQGVFFRYSTRHEALKLDLHGHARNLPDGSVEVLACGSAPALQQLREWLQTGPPSAKVRSVDCEPTEVIPPGGFTTG